MTDVQEKNRWVRMKEGRKEVRKKEITRGNMVD